MNTQLQGRHFHAAPAVRYDIPWIISAIREEDRLELERFYEESPERVLENSFEAALMCWTAYRPDGRPVAMWGVSGTEMDHVGVPWMVGTEYIKECYRDFLHFSRYFDGIMSSKFQILFNAVDSTYFGAHRWLEWMGYTAAQPVKSPKGFDFVLMVKDTQNVR